MANSLGRDIQQGEIVVLDGMRFSGDIYKRAFRCLAGFGMTSDLSGKAIYGHLVCKEPFADKEQCEFESFRVEGYEISKPDTEKYQRERGDGTDRPYITPSAAV